MPEERTAEKVKRYRAWYFGPQDVGGCPGCGKHWKRDRTGQSHSILPHTEGCDYLAWMDEEHEKNLAEYQVGPKADEDA
jgi:hypothetical protein